ncbi:hypothetical protein B0H66DRAFT_325997 [Apodospora peruviana]|uniref:EKC/KEOPS complex subunit GON7 n=1 Tax=Apodospora peruviana TaxID=516989 RepID=A0AAE0HXY4_9PEZI|nr:hypothetical protein B0H66DRAFT_325997 [Apodospora peruviana]
MTSQQPQAANGQSVAAVDKSSTMLSATYISSSGQNAPFSVSQQLSLPTAQPPTTQEQKSRYLRGLRTAEAFVQEQINKELTQRMEEDKARAEPSEGGSRAKRKAVDDEAEEENYGEEVVVED